MIQMDKKKKRIFIIVWVALILVLFAAVLLTGGAAKESEPVRDVMRDAVLHEDHKVSFLGWIDVNPGLLFPHCGYPALCWQLAALILDFCNSEVQVCAWQVSASVRASCQLV